MELEKERLPRGVTIEDWKRWLKINLGKFQSYISNYRLKVAKDRFGARDDKIKLSYANGVLEGLDVAQHIINELNSLLWDDTEGNTKAKGGVRCRRSNQ